MYEAFKNQLIADFEERRDLTVAEKRYVGSEPLFGTRSDDYQTYKRIIDSFTRVAQNRIQKLVMQLCEKYKFAATKGEMGDGWHIEVDHAGVRKRVVLYASPMAIDSGKIGHYVHSVAESDSHVYFVFLVKDSAESQHEINVFEYRLNRAAFEIYGYGDTSVDLDEKMTCMVFENFLELFFGHKEKEDFQAAMRGFKEEYHKAIGYQVTELCSPHNLKKLKETLDEDLKKFSYQRIREKHFRESKKSDPWAKDIFDSKFDAVHAQYVDGGKYKMMLSSADFAESFLTSEWLYRKYITLESLDNTFIVSGYLKSIEQLLWDIILIVGQGRKIRGCTIQSADDTEIDKTLGALEFFVGNWDNADLYDPSLKDMNHYFQNYLKSKIAQWRSLSRNGYFHKHKLESKEKVESIREDTIYLYFLILGSLNLTDEDIDKIIS